MFKEFKGAYPVIITPMNSQEEIDWEGLKRNIEHFISEGVAGLVINGSTGEFVSLSKSERFKVVETAVAQIKGRIPLLVGTAAETTKEAIEYTQQAEAAGASGALLINSYYAHPKEEEIYEHFKAVAGAVNFPIMIYNNPFTSGVDISTETILRVGRDIHNITHVKESSGDIRKVRDISRQGKGFIKTFCGSDDLVLESFLVGATGWISVAGNAAPKLVTNLFDAVENKELEKAWELYDKILPLCRFIEESGKYVQIIKRVMDLKGLAGGPSRKPRLPLTPEEDAKLQGILESLFVIQK
ncbi:4-hydroxy-tetrahydrodipicolinate synthase [Heyndrickxia shackletonii]|uniref:4-hydroxy-tetrahydrodipicolinate synthase n=1 Tax=Heyndrickxia shackletonii TaxID=157838 RepID=A0A0Q3WW32_9BACI|nr:4-hydroxy-tetrahydrodipicolinate synthase [Heyndrickxia shackletonii]KQL52884.1 4-hydroxy-tetrahydrodipicolinate synthase [Heyndrickxia shackletonii]NEZ00344.1 4-hydroxy-tetrahydrodipicolinate synthase [Heyndrickxia shackletonii]